MSWRTSSPITVPDAAVSNPMAASGRKPVPSSASQASQLIIRLPLPRSKMQRPARLSVPRLPGRRSSRAALQARHRLLGLLPQARGRSVRRALRLRGKSAQAPAKNAAPEQRGLSIFKVTLRTWRRRARAEAGAKRTTRTSIASAGRRAKATAFTAVAVTALFEATTVETTILALTEAATTTRRAKGRTTICSEAAAAGREKH